MFVPESIVTGWKRIIADGKVKVQHSRSDNK